MTTETKTQSKDVLIQELRKEISKLETKLSDLECENENLQDEVDNLTWQEVSEEEDIKFLEERDIYPRKEVTLPELMKFEFLKENWDKITLEQLEELC